MTPRTAQGLFVTFEGIEGSGKTTQLRLLAESLRGEGFAVEVVREPGGTGLGESLRQILLSYDGEAIDGRAELFLYLSARAQLVTRVIRPALREGRVVLADRFGDASVAYQGGGRALGPSRVRSLVRFATGGLVPARTYLFDMDPAEALARVRSRGKPDRLESEGIEFHRTVRRTYIGIARAEPDRIRTLRGRDPIERLAARIRKDIGPILPPAGARAPRGGEVAR